MMIWALYYNNGALYEKLISSKDSALPKFDGHCTTLPDLYT